jgi:hypothetical protein
VHCSNSHVYESSHILEEHLSIHGSCWHINDFRFRFAPQEERSLQGLDACGDVLLESGAAGFAGRFHGGGIDAHVYWTTGLRCGVTIHCG